MTLIYKFREVHMMNKSINLLMDNELSTIVGGTSIGTTTGTGPTTGITGGGTTTLPPAVVAILRTIYQDSPPWLQAIEFQIAQALGLTKNVSPT